jgi:hypothetical protein
LTTEIQSLPAAALWNTNISHNQIVDFDPADDDRLGLRGLPILVDLNDYEGIHIASSNLALDLEKVTGCKSEVWTSTDNVSTSALGVILVGSTQKCRYLQGLSTNVLERKENGNISQEVFVPAPGRLWRKFW